jgi:hypothetical protein
LILPFSSGEWESNKKLFKEEFKMTNFIKKIVGVDSKKEQGSCCGVEFKEITPEQAELSGGCCSPSSDDNTQAGCC